MVKKKPACYTTTDGEEFVDEDQATAHQELLDSERNLKGAQDRFCSSKAVNTTMADGIKFDFGRWTYYALIKPYGSVPRADRVLIDRWNIFLDMNGDACVCETVEDGRGSRPRDPRQWKISELYGTEQGAREACAAAMKQWLIDRQAEIARQLKEWGMP
jgi:hypothetical protein